MKENISVKDIADLFHIAPSALRYWDEKGLIRFERSPDNNYRRPTFQTMMDICDIMLYRTLSTPLKSIEMLPNMNEEQLQMLLGENEEKLKKQIQELEDSIGQIQVKQSMIKRFKMLKSLPFSLQQDRLPAIKLFSFEHEESLQVYIYHSYQTTVIMNPYPDAIPQFGLFVSDEEEPVLREGDSNDKLYLKGLLRVDSNCPTSYNREEFRQAAQDLGHTPGKIIGRYLISACEDKRYDYFEAWMELS